MLTDEEKGEQLKQFFWALLADGEKMAHYQGPTTRSSAIDRHAHDDVKSILESGTLAEIEGYIRLATGNPTSRWPVIVVWPP